MSPDATTTRAIQAGIVALVHQLAREMEEWRRIGSEEARLRVEWTATDLAILAALLAERDGR